MPRFSRVLGLTVGVILAFLLALISAAPASATTTSASGSDTYLALGDSVPFGYDPLVSPPVTPDDFVGYPQLAAALFTPNLKVSNASCPGETSTSLITGTLPDNGCQAFRKAIGLHVTYSGSQLQFAKSYVADNPRTKMVSLMVGGNDLLLLQGACEKSSPASVNDCILSGLPRLLARVGANVATVYQQLRASGFKGDFVGVTYYSANYQDRFMTGVVGALNLVLAGVAKAFHGKVADGFTAFARAAAPFKGDSCAAGLLIRLTADSCNIHPSPAGAALLASAVRSAEGP